MKSKLSKKTWNEWRWGWFMVAPTIIGLIVLNIIPIIQTFYLSFFKSGAFGNGNKFVGLDNYNRLIHDPQVWCAVRNTLVYTCMVVPITVIIALLLAVVLNGKIRGKGIYRSIF